MSIVIFHDEQGERSWIFVTHEVLDFTTNNKEMRNEMNFHDTLTSLDPRRKGKESNF